jgi:hypothetical protein
MDFKPEGETYLSEVHKRTGRFDERDLLRRRYGSHHCGTYKYARAECAVYVVPYYVRKEVTMRVLMLCNAAFLIELAWLTVWAFSS